MDIYREKLLDHYQHPRNMHELSGADAELELENVSCGDRIKVYLKLDKDTISDVAFTGEGCAIAVASASLLSEYIKGMKFEQFAKINLKKLMQLLGVELTPTRTRCAYLCLEAMKKALKLPVDPLD